MTPCSFCTRRRPVPPVGPQPCAALFLGESAGWDEDKRQIPFIGKSGNDLNFQYLPLCGLTRDVDVRITNAQLCVPTTDDGRPDPEVLRQCARTHLPSELALTNPQYIVTIGAMALELFGDYSLELEHGLPLENQYYAGWSGTIFPVYHPAAALRDPGRYMTRCQDDFRALREWRHGRLTRPIDPYPNPDYRELRTHDDMLMVVANSLYSPISMERYEVAVDTETYLGRPWCLTFSLKPGTGYMIRSDNRELLHYFSAWAEYRRPLFLIHNWLFDAPILRDMGISGFRFRDTMQQAYIAGTDQSLKVLAYRLCGMVMQDYDDLIMPYAREMAMAYLRMAAQTEILEYVDSLPWKPATRRCSGGKKFGGKHLSCPIYYDSPVPQSCVVCGQVKDPPQMERDKGGRQYIWDRARRIVEDVESGKSDPLHRWKLIPPEEQAPMVSILGPMPLPSISQVPHDKAVYYACLSGDSRVLTPSGYMPIGRMVKSKYSGNVMSWDADAERLVERPVTGWHRVEHKERIKWFSILTEHSRGGRWGAMGARYTPDHKILTGSGMKPVSDLSRGEWIVLPYDRLDSLQVQVTIGSGLCGDGTLTRKNGGGWSCLRMKHCEKQIPYLNWKRELLGNLVGGEYTTPASEMEICGRASHRSEALTLATLHHPEIDDLFSEAYASGKRHAGSWLNCLGWLGLAICYQDNGTLVRSRKRPQYSYARIYLPGTWDEGDCNLFQKRLHDLGVDTTSYNPRPGQWALHVRSTSSDRFFAGVASYTHPALQYKLPYEYRDSFIGASDRLYRGPMLSRVTDIIDRPAPPSRRGSAFISYCIDVEGTHNFATQGEIAKNCRDADATLRIRPKLTTLSSTQARLARRGAPC